MKHLKHLLAASLAMFLAFVLAVPAFAAGTGSITIKPPSDVDSKATNTYTIYKVFDADGNGTNISYKLVSGKTIAPAGFTVDSAGNVTYGGTGTDGQLTDADIAAIAAYVTQSDIVGTATSKGSANATIDNLPNGYYYITTSTGTVVTIDSTNPKATVNDKNIVPTVDKTVTGASSMDDAGKKALAQVGTEVEYKVEITVGKGQTNYLFKDTLGNGLSYVADSLEVKDMTAGTDYTLTVNGQNIQVKFENNSIKNLAQNSKITVTYKATVTSDALSTDPAKNTATISYGNNSSYTSEPSVVEVYNAKFTVTKKDGEDQPLANAGFVVAKTVADDSDGAEEGATKTVYYKLTTNNDGTKSVSWVDSIDDATEYKSDATGAVTAFTGLADGTYTLIEKTVPAGYNKAADSTFTIAAKDYTTDNLEQSTTVVNNAGTELPSTGGMGTTILYIVGGALVIGGGVALIVKRRVASMEQ